MISIRFSPLTALILAALLLIPAAAFLASHIAGPSDGARLEPGSDNIPLPGVKVTVLLPQEGGLQSGDIVTHMQGRSMEAWAQALFEPEFERTGLEKGDIIQYRVLRSEQPIDVQLTLGNYPLRAVLQSNWGTILFALVFQIVATYVFIRRPAHHAGRILFLSASSILSATTWSFGLHLLDFYTGVGFWLYKITTWGAYSLFWISSFHFAAVFPHPLPLIQRKPWIIPSGYLGAVVFAATWVLVTQQVATSTLDWLRLWIPSEAAVAGVFLAASIAAFTWQYRIHKSGVQRQQIRWVIWSGIFSGAAGLIFYILPGLVGGSTINPNLAGLIVLPVPLSIAIAILRHNLFEIDRLINRTLVYGALTVLSGSIYLTVVGTIGLFFQAQGNWVISLIATGVVAILFHPLRERINRWVNRRMYGDRDEPFEVLARLGHRLESSLSYDAVLPTLVETIAQTLKLPYVALRLLEPAPPRLAASYGRPTSAIITYPLIHQSDTIGELLVARRADDEDFTVSEERLLRSIARQAGAAVQTVKLTADLQASRQRLVTAQEEERLRLRRDLHDGLGPTLAAHLFKLGLARSYLDQDTARADLYLEQLEEETEGILAEVRRLVYNLRPPTLDQLGLLGAISAVADGYNHPHKSDGRLQVEVRAPNSIPALPAAVEVAAYRIVQEALNNAARHAGASCCNVELWLTDHLNVKIRDNGRGLPSQPTAGVGLSSMRERAHELGGHLDVHSTEGSGTEIHARIPISVSEGS
jgi:two-component system, NarL family, sensor kinase